MNHQHWQDLMPYYVNQTLPPPDRAAFEHHLTTCQACCQSLEEWRRVAGVVQREVAAWTQHTPPLSFDIHAQAGPVPSANGYDQYRSARGPDGMIPLRDGRGVMPARHRIQLPLTLAAAALVIVVFGVLLLYMARGNDDVSQGSQPETNNVYPTGTATQVRPTDTPFFYPSPSPPMDLGILGPAATATPLVLGTPVPSDVEGTNGIGAGGASSLSDYECFAAPATNDAVAIYESAVGGAIVGYMTPGEWLGVFQRSLDGWYMLVWPTRYIAGWVPGNALVFDGLCDSLPNPTPTELPPPITPTAGFRSSIGMGYMMITVEQAGVMPANTRVRISHAWFDSTGWWYYVVAEDETTTAEVREWQLAYAPGITPGPTPTAMYMGQSLITREQVGAIPAGTRVRASGQWFNGYDWEYTVVTESGVVADALQSQLALLPPTPIIGPTPTNAYWNIVGSGDYCFVTREQVGAIPPFTAVRIDAAWFDGSEWNYTVVTEQGLSGTARLSQIRYPPPEFFVTLTATAIGFPSPTFTPTPLPTLANQAQIHRFAADSDPAAPGALLVLEWETSHAVEVSIREVYQSGTFGQWYADLPATGTLDVVVPENGDSAITYVLVVKDANGREITEQVTVGVAGS